MVAKHGTLGLVLFTTIMCGGALFGFLVVVGVVLLVASGGATYASWTIGIAVIGELYSMLRLLQIVPTKPNERDNAFLSRTQHGAAQDRTG